MKTANSEVMASSGRKPGREVSDSVRSCGKAHVPNAATRKAMRDADAGKGRHFDNLKTLFAEWRTL